MKKKKKKKDIYLKDKPRIDFDKIKIDDFLKKTVGTKRDKKRIKEIYNLC